MITFNIILNKTYKNTKCLITEKVKGNYITVDHNLKIILIDNIQIELWDEIHEVRFMVDGYYQIININQTGKIEATDIEFNSKEVK